MDRGLSSVQTRSCWCRRIKENKQKKGRKNWGEIFNRPTTTGIWVAINSRSSAFTALMSIEGGRSSDALDWYIALPGVAENDFCPVHSFRVASSLYCRTFTTRWLKFMFNENASISLEPIATTISRTRRSDSQRFPSLVHRTLENFHPFSFNPRLFLSINMLYYFFLNIYWIEQICQTIWIGNFARLWDVDLMQIYFDHTFS